MSQHLSTAHRLDARTASSRLEAYHVGPNHQHGFWCGFCRQVIRLITPKGIEAYDERFTHIDQHLVKEQRPIEDWVDVRAGVTKREMRARRERKERHDRAVSAGAEEAADALGQAAAAATAQAQAQGPPMKKAKVAEAHSQALAEYREVEERRGRANQEEFGHTMWICVRLLSLASFDREWADGGSAIAKM
jgi:hypothetical protein